VSEVEPLSRHLPAGRQVCFSVAVKQKLMKRD